jgi:hypothetical protein
MRLLRPPVEQALADVEHQRRDQADHEQRSGEQDNDLAALGLRLRLGPRSATASVIDDKGRFLSLRSAEWGRRNDRLELVGHDHLHDVLATVIAIARARRRIRISELVHQVGTIDSTEELLITPWRTAWRH